MGLLEIFQKRERKQVRRALRTECHAVAEDGFRFLGERTLDLSEGGILLRSDAEAEVGESVLLSLRVPNGRTWIDAQAIVTRVVRGLRAGDEGRAYGLAFEDIAPLDRAILAGSLGGPPPTPTRGLRRDYAGSVLALAL
ncbi:MAG: PilZ domain-containing protein [Sandaracinus sp.]|nr:PilZ domain-containing protein [Sandaracinus sp.]|tara:strand:+ start:107 stop:523 length:417 start_codon:yes stop_codon:yes gene_type:complete